MVNDFLVSQFQDRGFGLIPSKFNYCLISSNRKDNGNDLLFLFRKKEYDPCFVAKIGRTSDSLKTLSNEFKWVGFLTDRLIGCRLLPLMHFSGEWDGRGYFVQDIIKGVGLDKALFRSGLTFRTQRCLTQAIDFLVELRGLFHPDEADRLNEASKLFEEHLESVELSPRQRTRIRESAKAVGLIPCFTHGDFWATNIIVDTKETRITGIIDFEYASDSCYTYFDLFWFMVNLPMFLKESLFNGNLLLSYKYIFSKGYEVPLFRKVIEYFFGKIGQKTPSLFDFFLVSLLYGSFREMGMFGTAFSMDIICSEMLRWSLENEQLFRMS